MTRLARIALDGCAVLAVVALLLWPALYNGYPLIYPDSSLYIALSFAPQEYVPRGLPYPLLLYGFHLGQSLWPAIAGQALIAAWVLHETVAVFFARRRALWLLALAIVLAFLTGLPWTVDQVMPDFAAGVLVLAIVLPLLFGERLSPLRRALLLAIALVGVAIHSSHAPLALGLILAAAIVLAWLRLPLRPLLPPLAATLGGVLVAIAIHFGITGHAYYARGGEQFLFGRMVGDGIVADYLNEVCPRADFKLCALRDRLPRTNNLYLWRDLEAFELMGGWDGSPELRAIMLGSIERMPLRHAAAVVVDTSRQLFTVGLGDSLQRASPETNRIVEIAFPDDALAFHAALQQQNELKPTIRLFNLFQLPLQLGALAALPLLVIWLIGPAQTRQAAFCLLVLAALLANAFICGVFSGVAPRYQNRIVWLAVATVAVVGASGIAGRRQDG